MTGITTEGEKRLIETVVDQYKDSSTFFIYPKEVTTSMDFVPLMERAGQGLVLTNGKLLNRDGRLEQLKEAGIETLKITYFSMFEEQERWQNISKGEYRRIGKNIDLAKAAGFNVFINTVLWKENMRQVPALVAQAENSGVDRISLIRFRLRQENDEYITAREMPALVEIVEKIKQEQRLPTGECKENGEPFKGPRLQFSVPFAGPDFVNRTREKLTAMRPKKGDWVKSPYLCPAIDQNYWAIAPKTGTLSWCYFVADQPEGRLGSVDVESGKVTIDRNVDLRPETLREKLRGSCSKEACQEYQSTCLGGCRSTAMTAALWRGEEDSLYAPMDICLSRAKKEVLGLPWYGR